METMSRIPAYEKEKEDDKGNKNHSKEGIEEGSEGRTLNEDGEHAQKDEHENNGH
jgi:hypothetical protein